MVPPRRSAGSDPPRYGAGVGRRTHAEAAGAQPGAARAPDAARARAVLYAAAEAWVGPPEVGADDALDHLVRRYLGAFGPASPADIAGWAGIPRAAIAPALGRLALRRFRAEDGSALVDLPRAPLP